MLFEASATPVEVAAALKAAMIYIAILALLGVALSIPVMLRRRQAKIGIGDGGDRELLRRMRIHGNFIEQATLGLPLLALLPFAGAPALAVHLFGGHCFWVACCMRRACSLPMVSVSVEQPGCC